MLSKHFTFEEKIDLGEIFSICVTLLMVAIKIESTLTIGSVSCGRSTFLSVVKRRGVVAREYFFLLLIVLWCVEVIG